MSVHFKEEVLRMAPARIVVTSSGCCEIWVGERKVSFGTNQAAAWVKAYSILKSEAV